MKYVSMRMPDAGPFGDTFFDASVRAIVAASFVKRPAGGFVESVVTVRTHLASTHSFGHAKGRAGGAPTHVVILGVGVAVAYCGRPVGR